MTYPREHGTVRGYSQHKYRKEKQCDECLDAMAAWRHTRFGTSGQRGRPEDTKRNAEILERLQAGEIMQTIANDYGVSRQRIAQIAEWHGISRRQVRQAEKFLREQKRKLVAEQRRKNYKHGTVNGYRRHQADGETPCEPCRKANALAGRIAYRRRNPNAKEYNPVIGAAVRAGILKARERS